MLIGQIIKSIASNADKGLNFVKSTPLGVAIDSVTAVCTAHPLLAALFGMLLGLLALRVVMKLI